MSSPTTKLPIVCLHGFMGTGADWQAVAAKLPGQPLTPDLPWHGQRLGDRPQSWQEAVDHVAAGLPPRFHLAGYSFGARIGLGLLAKHPHRLASLALLSGNPGITDVADRRARENADAKLAQRLSTTPLADFLDWWYGLPLFVGVAHRPDLRQALIARRLANDPEALADCLAVAGAAKMPDYRSVLTESELPMLYLAGARDSKYAATANEIRRLRPATKVTIVPDSSHALVQEAPDAVIANLTDFHANLY